LKSEKLKRRDYSSVILLTITYEYEAWSLTLRGTLRVGDKVCDVSTVKKITT